MKFELRLLNCFWLVVPLLIWNILLGPEITIEQVVLDAHSPQWLLILENVIRMAAFALLLFIPLKLDNTLAKVGLALCITGMILYFVSWLPLLLYPRSAWSLGSAGLLATCITPLLPFRGITLIGGSWVFGGAAFFFIFFHTWQGRQNLWFRLEKVK